MSQQKIRRHNETVLEELETGDLVEFNRGLYSHWAVYIGDETVVHLTGDSDLSVGVSSCSVCCSSGMGIDKAFVKTDSFWDVVLGSKAFKNNNKDKKHKPKPREKIVKDALAEVGKKSYNVLWENCEHFASYCRYDVEESDQSRTFLTMAAIGAGFGLAASLLFGGKKKKK